MKIFLVGGARPNFVKIAALSDAFRDFKKTHPKSKLAVCIIHTGQHYDYLMTRKFFQDLDIPKPYRNLNIGSSSHADQTARIMMAFEKVLIEEPPDLVMVVGDVNSTMAASLVAVKMGIPVAHVEAGLRSFDRSMPEEINRIVTDSVAEFLFTTCQDADRNLKREGIESAEIYFVGNVMVDSLLSSLAKAKKTSIREKLGLRGPYAVLTLHRPSNVDCESDFSGIVRALERIQRRIPIVFPVHPRTKARFSTSLLGKKLSSLPNLILRDPLGYLDFIHLMSGARLVLTDSGGIQEETTVLGVPCLTIRDNTERPVTIYHGTNILAGRKTDRIVRLAETILKAPAAGKTSNSKKYPRRPPLWDGRSAGRIVRILSKKFGF